MAQASSPSAEHPPAPHKPGSGWKTYLQYILGIGLGVGLMGWVLWRLNWEEAQAELMNAHWGYLLLSLAAGMASHYLRALRWAQLLKAAGSPVRRANAFSATLMGYGVNNLVPRLGEVVRFAILVRSDRMKIASGAGTVVTERAIDMLTALLMVLVMLLLEFDAILNLFAEQGVRLPFSGASSGLLLGLLVLLGLLGLGVFYRYHCFLLRFKLYEKIFGFVRQLLEAILSIRKLERTGLFVLYSLGVWLLYVTMWYCMLQAFPLTQGLNFYFAFLMTNFGTLAMLLPAPGGAGTFQIASGFMFWTFGAQFGLAGSPEELQESGQLVGFLAHVPHYILNSLAGLGGYIFLLLNMPKTDRSAAERELDELD